jgi:hypothetical protein
LSSATATPARAPDQRPARLVRGSVCGTGVYAERRGGGTRVACRGGDRSDAGAGRFCIIAAG